MDLEKRVGLIEQKLGISIDPASMDPASMDPASTDPASMDSAPTDSAPTDPASMDSAPTEPASTEPASTDVSPVPSTDVSPVPSTDVSPLPESTIISFNEYNGTLKDLFSKIRSKISDLDRATNKGRYSSRVIELKTLLKNLTKATTVQDVKSTIGTKLQFKNGNSLMGGKSKKRGRKSKKSNKSKRRLRE
jgi:hypothetical protein